MMIAYIDEYRGRFGVEPICWTLGASLEGGFITSRGYRLAKSRPASARSIRDWILAEELREIHAHNFGVYGIRKMWHAVRRAGWDIGRDQGCSTHENRWDCWCSPGTHSNNNQTRSSTRFSPGFGESAVHGQ